MLVIRLFMHNSLRNFNYLIACAETGEALVIDPLNAQLCLDTAKKHDWRISKIVNTHEHWDHIAGNGQLQAATGATVYAHAAAKGKIPEQTQGLKAGDIIHVGQTVALEVLDTPGHTFSHVCLLAHGDHAALFCGDTLFNAGAGNCHSGDMILLYQSFSEQLAKLANHTKIYPGHDYMLNNLAFALDREPHNHDAGNLLSRLDKSSDYIDTVTELCQEKLINPFLRLTSPELIEQLRQDFPDLKRHPSPREIFLCLRQLRNSW